jgi:hypothetical protein
MASSGACRRLEEQLINQEELAICRRRGHNTPVLRHAYGWVQCEQCGMWLREVTTLEEREDDPPAAEISTFHKMSRTVKERERDDAAPPTP